MIDAPELAGMVSRYAREDIAYAQAGGGTTAGGAVMGMVTARGGHVPKRSNPPVQRLGLRKFLEADSVMVNPFLHEQSIQAIPGAAVDMNQLDELCVASRRDVIKYVAHHLGGTHLGGPKSDAERKLWGALDYATARMHVMEKPAIYYELLSIGRLVAESADTNRFLDAVR